MSRWRRAAGTRSNHGKWISWSRTIVHALRTDDGVEQRGVGEQEHPDVERLARIVDRLDDRPRRVVRKYDQLVRHSGSPGQAPGRRVYDAAAGLEAAPNWIRCSSA